MKYHNSKKSAGGLTPDKIMEAFNTFKIGSPAKVDAEFLSANDCGPRTIAATVFDRRLVSTVQQVNISEFLGFKFVEAKYETALFDREGRGEVIQRYETAEEARTGHWAVCLVHLQSQ